MSINLLDVGIDLLSGGRVLEGYLSSLVESVEGEVNLILLYNSWSSCQDSAICFDFSLKGRIKA